MILVFQKTFNHTIHNDLLHMNDLDHFIYFILNFITFEYIYSRSWINLVFVSRLSVCERIWLLCLMVWSPIAIRTFHLNVTSFMFSYTLKYYNITCYTFLDISFNRGVAILNQKWSIIFGSTNTYTRDNVSKSLLYRFSYPFCTNPLRDRFSIHPIS